MCLMPGIVAIEFSILRATSVSSCAGAAPGSAAVTMTVGRSMSGKFWIFIARKLISPSSVSRMKSSSDGIGLRIDQVDRFIAAASLHALGYRDRVAIDQEADAGVDDGLLGGEPLGDLYPVTLAPPGLDLDEPHA